MKPIIFTVLILSTTFCFAEDMAKQNRKQFMDTCISAYQEIAKSNLNIPSKKSEKPAKESCEEPAKIYDKANMWADQTDKGKGCEFGVRMALRNYPELGSAHNLNDWKKYYGATCGNWDGQ